MTPELRTLTADLLALYGGLPDPGDGVSLAALPPADREAIGALIWADPLYDPDGADAPHPDYGLWPTEKVCRALGKMLKDDDHENVIMRLRGEVDTLMGAMIDRSYIGGGTAYRAYRFPETFETRELAAAAVRSRLRLDGGTVCRAEMMGVDDQEAEVTRLQGEVDTLMGAMITKHPTSPGCWGPLDEDGFKRYYPSREQAVEGVRRRLGMNGASGGHSRYRIMTEIAKSQHGPLPPPQETLEE